MSFSATTRHLMVTGAIVLASVIEVERGYKPLVVIVGAIAFLCAGNLIVYLSGAKERAMKRRQKRDYYEGKV